MKFKLEIALLVSMAALFAQPSFAQLQSVVETETSPPDDRLARLNDELGHGSGRPKFDRIAMNQPGDAPSIFSAIRTRPDFEAQRKDNSREIQPQTVKIGVTGPKELVKGRACKFVATLENPTSTVFKDLQISLSPDSRFAPAPNSQLTLYLAELDPHFRARFEFNLTAEKPGIADLEFVASGKFAVTRTKNTLIQNQTDTPGISVSTFHRVQVVSPPAEAELSGPSLLHIGTEAEYAIKIINTSERPVHNVRATLQIPRGLEVTILDRVSKPNPKQRSITWHVPVINNNRHEVIRFKAQATSKGQQLAKVVVFMGEQPQGESTLETEVVGKPKPEITNHIPNHRIAKKPIQNYHQQPK